MVNRADARGGIWDVEVVEEIIGRPLHHTLLIVESQQAVSIVFQCPAYRLSPIAYRLKPNTVKSRYGLVRGDVVFEQQIVTFKRRGAKSFP